MTAIRTFALARRRILDPSPGSGETYRGRGSHGNRVIRVSGVRCAARVWKWPGAGAAPVSRGVVGPHLSPGGDVADCRGPRHASPASGIEASSTVTAKKLGGSV
jgi:hypothetical protein